MVNSWEGVERRSGAGHWVIPVPHFQPVRNTQSQAGRKMSSYRGAIFLNYLCRRFRRYWLSPPHSLIGSRLGTRTRLGGGISQCLEWNTVQFLTNAMALPSLKFLRESDPYRPRLGCQPELDRI